MRVDDESAIASDFFQSQFGEKLDIGGAGTAVPVVDKRLSNNTSYECYVPAVKQYVPTTNCISEYDGNVQVARVDRFIEI